MLNGLIQFIKMIFRALVPNFSKFQYLKFCNPAFSEKNSSVVTLKAITNF